MVTTNNKQQTTTTKQNDRQLAPLCRSSQHNSLWNSAMNSETQKLVEENRQALKLLKTAPYSGRFPNQRQDNYCWAAYVQHFKCAKEKDESDPECQKYKFYYQELCPTSWVLATQTDSNFSFFFC
jgi:hypothetical protein